MKDISETIRQVCAQIRQGVDLANVDIDETYKIGRLYKVEMPGDLHFELDIAGGKVSFSVVISEKEFAEPNM